MYDSISITIETENEAFMNGNKGTEIARVLRDLAERLADGRTPARLKDINGNVVAKIEYVWDQSPIEEDYDPEPIDG